MCICLELHQRIFSKLMLLNQNLKSLNSSPLGSCNLSHGTSIDPWIRDFAQAPRRKNVTKKSVQHID